MKKTAKFLVSLIMLLLILCSIVWYLFVYDRSFTRDSLLNQARYNDLHGNTQLSSWFYDMAYTFSGKDKNVAIELANQYKSRGNYTKSEYTLTNAINSSPTAELYTALCRTFVEQDKILDAENLLQNISNADIAQAVSSLRPAAPTADKDPGYFSKYISVQLDAGDNVIYYSIDGSYPSIHGTSYSGPIELPAGQTTIQAVSINQSGLVSPITTLEYTITGVIEEVTFTDPALEAGIREVIGVDSDAKVLTNALWAVTSFSVPEGTEDLSDLRLLPYLTSLTIENQSIASFDSLSTLTSLKTLNLSGSTFPVAELATLSILPYLTELNLSACGLSTIAGLAGAPSLTVLNLSNNTIRNLEVLAPMTGIQEVQLQHNAVTDLSVFSNLLNLNRLDVSFNAVTSLAPLAKCTKLTWLGADNNQLSSLDGVNQIPQLSHFSAGANALTDVSLLSGCVSLKELNISSNEIEDLSSLSSLTKLEHFDFSSNKVENLPDWPDGCALLTINGSYNALTDISVLKRMDSLTHVYMDYNLITDINALSNCYCLVQVNVYGNAIEDVSALREHDIIVNYDPTKA